MTIADGFGLIHTLLCLRLGILVLLYRQEGFCSFFKSNRAPTLVLVGINGAKIDFLLSSLFSQSAALLGTLGSLAVLDGIEHGCGGFESLLAHITGFVGTHSLFESVLVQLAILTAAAVGSIAIGSGAGSFVSGEFSVKLSSVSTRQNSHFHGTVIGIVPDLPGYALFDFSGIAFINSLLLRVCKAEGFLPVRVVFILEGRISQTGFLADAECHAYLCCIGRCKLGINVQYAIQVFCGTVKIAVLHEQIGALHQAADTRCNTSSGVGLHHLLHHLGLLRLLVGIKYLLDAAEQILHETDLAHVLALEGGQLLRQVVGIHAAIARDQQALPVLCHQGQVAAPLVLHPHGVEVLRPAADDHHHPRTVQRREDVGLVLLAQLVFQRDAAEEHLIALLGQAIVHILRPLAVTGALTLLVCLLVADEHIVGFLVGRNSEDALLDLGNLCGLLLVQVTGGGVGGILHRGQIVRICEDACHLHSMTSGDSLFRGRVLDILDAVAADDCTPVGFGIRVILFQQLLVSRHGLVKLALAAEVVCPVVAVQLALVIRLRDG